MYFHKSNRKMGMQGIENTAVFEGSWAKLPHVPFTEKLYFDLTYEVTKDSGHEGAQFLVRALRRRKGI
ncbi:MAG: hypothetical protein EPN97_04825 [Alphaproteobacteria bacterium]|nr:MAG: hypothetical protein EPN97_04825 [Alphaproteobacteria bacterium]